MGKNMAKGSIKPHNSLTKDILTVISSIHMASQIIIMARNTKAIFKKVKKQEKEFTHGLTARITRDSIKTM